MRDYRFDFIAYSLRSEDSSIYSFSRIAAEELSRNTYHDDEYTEDMWDDFWAELNKEFEEK